MENVEVCVTGRTDTASWYTTKW